MTIIIAFAVLFLLLFLGVPIAFALGLVGFAGFAVVVGLNPALAMVGQIAADTVLNYTLSVAPLFILMGNLVNHSGLSRELYDSANAFLGHRRGGLAMATVVACGGFASVCGSSVATAATMSKVAMPSMSRYGYAPSLSAGAIAAGGTLGILIPPSVPLVIYGAMTETDVGKLFIAGIVPGVLLVVLYIMTVALVTYRDPTLGPRGDRVGIRDRFLALRRVWGVIGLFALVMGGIYFGVFTPTEAAGIGAGGAFLLALLRGSLTLSHFTGILIESARTTTVIFLLFIGAVLFANFVDVTRLPYLLANWIASLNVPPIGVLLSIVLIYMLLGCVMEALSMMLLTVPLFFPIVTGLGYDPIWFGILVIVVVELGLITPPIGLNVFVLHAMYPDIGVTTIFRGAMPFVAADALLLALLIAFPAVALYLPGLTR